MLLLLVDGCSDGVDDPDVLVVGALEEVGDALFGGTLEVLVGTGELLDEAEVLNDAETLLDEVVAGAVAVARMDRELLTL